MYLILLIDYSKNQGVRVNELIDLEISDPIGITFSTYYITYLELWEYSLFHFSTDILLLGED